MERHVDEKIYLPSLITGAAAGDDGCVLRDHHFTGCTIYGPAVVRLLESTSLEQPSTFTGRVDELLVADDRDQLLGVIGIANCTFESCRFVGIAFSCPSDELDAARAVLRERLI